MSDRAPAFDPLDPHGFHARGHITHRIVPVATLVAVLAALLTFTVLTVAAQRLELWATVQLGIDLPGWVNVLVAMSIAVIKASLVAAFFMQLRYDNPLNTAILLFCVLAVGLFIGLSMLDLGTRGSVDPEHQGTIVMGGTSNFSRPAVGWDEQQQKRVPLYDENGNRMEEVVSGPITEFSRQKWLAIWGEEEFARREAEAHGGHGSSHEGAAPSDADHARPRVGPTPGLFGHAGETGAAH